MTGGRLVFLDVEYHFRMTNEMAKIGHVHLEDVEAATERLLATVSGLTDSQVSGATLVPPWTRGHVVSHVARAGDSLCRLLEWARTGVETPQYASMAAREAEIEAGAYRPADALVRDVTESAERFHAAVRALPDAAWQAVVRPRTGEPATPERLVLMRLRELEVHHADLRAGYDFADVPEAAARWIVQDILTTQSARPRVPALRISATDTELTGGVGEGGPLVTGTLAALLAWLSGRSTGAGLSVRGADEVPAAPFWV